MLVSMANVWPRRCPEDAWPPFPLEVLWSPLRAAASGTLLAICPNVNETRAARERPGLPGAVGDLAQFIVPAVLGGWFIEKRNEVELLLVRSSKTSLVQRQDRHRAENRLG